jgi:hypothetical protein
VAQWDTDLRCRAVGCSRLCELRAIDLSRPALNPKNKVEKSGQLLAANLWAVCTTFYHAFHHVLTIKKPRSTTSFFQNPPQKHQQKRENPAPPPPQDFFNEAKHFA